VHMLHRSGLVVYAETTACHQSAFSSGQGAHGVAYVCAIFQG
jgi:hypothetical protein